MATIKDKLATVIGGEDRPEIVQAQVEEFLSTIDDVTDLDEDGWIELLEDIKDDVEFGEATWRGEE